MCKTIRPNPQKTNKPLTYIKHVIMKKIAEFRANTISARVFYDDYFEEYSVKLYNSNIKINGATYYTPDRDDALVTAEVMIKNFKY